MKRSLYILAAALACPFAANAEITLPEIIGPDMVLQQQADARLWGWATPGATVSVTTSWDNTTTTARADQTSGRWELTVATPEASFDARTIKITGDGSSIELDNVLVGEVWFCSGQSNMEMPLRGFWCQPIEGASQAIAYAGKYPAIRMATVPKSEAATPQDRAPGRWLVSNPENAPEFSALGYFFARSLHDILNVPVGIITCAYGGSKLESWLPREIVATYSDIDVDGEIAGTTDTDDWHRTVVRYNAMLNPVVGYTIKGFLWNQGESNVGLHDTYPERMVTMVNHWRDRWGQGQLPFYQVEIPGWDYGDPQESGAALFRECQHRAASMMERGGIVCTSDLVYPEEVHVIHATQKQPLGERMAFLVGADVYGITNLPHVYPQCTGHKLSGDCAYLYFENVEGFPLLREPLEGFEVAGDDRVFYPATATVSVDANSKPAVKVSAPQVGDVKAVRYCFKNFAVGRIHGMDGLPLVPFRTDDWEK